MLGNARATTADVTTLQTKVGWDKDDFNIETEPTFMCDHGFMDLSRIEDAAAGLAVVVHDEV